MIFLTYSFCAFEELENSLCRSSTDFNLLSSFTLNNANPAGVSNKTSIFNQKKLKKKEIKNSNFFDLRFY